MKLIKTPIKIPKGVSLSIFISLLIHGALMAVIVLHNTDLSKPLSQTNVPVEVELVEAQLTAQPVRNAQPNPPQPNGQIVQQDEKELNDETPVNTRFLSRHNQVVKQQEQALVNGKFKNSDETLGEKTENKKVGQLKSTDIADQVREKKSEPRVDPLDEKPEKNWQTAEDGLDAGLAQKSAKLKTLMPSFRPTAPDLRAPELAAGGGSGPSATDDRLKDVKVGTQTVLSTREFLYYSYYNRIRTKLTQYWQPKIREKMERIMKQGRTIASTGDKVTRIVIVLDGQGLLRKVQILSASGVSDLDDAAVEAFRQAAPFPNPPKGMVDADGTIRIRWDFVLEA